MNVFIEGLGAIIALWNEVKTNVADVFLGTEIFGLINFFALNLQFHEAPIRKAYFVTCIAISIKRKNFFLPFTSIFGAKVRKIN